MLLPIPEEVLQTQARDRVIDAWLSSLGVSAAVVSASFAGYMFVAGPGSRPASGQAPVLAMGASIGRAPRALAPPPHAAFEAAPPDAENIDFDPTGSIPGLPGNAVAKPDPAAAARAVLPDFAVRDAFEGTALVEAQGTLQMVQPGSEVKGAGTVTSITRRGKIWVVATTGGIIVQRR